ncbi:AraC family transcriptional regulator [Emticicia sp. TH156]|uniref:AraC family transcriptional regulator n=1 Tax=Emticicia sp. TH156 TaxID=2067454 RepID=UPI000C758B74|nr:AraC family transcriptional regulator [Emticicia sp. TH156]PLK42775.1 AraC family transcriptional regulator [Emticicia sp. TH156]
MKPILKKSVDSVVYSFTLKELVEPHFDPNWHFHPHYQLFTVLEGSGTRFIGDNIRHFEAGDTVFLGPNIPHLWQSDRVYFDHNSGLQTHGIVIYFTEDFLGDGFFEKSEMHPLKQLLEKGERGLDIFGGTRDYIRHELQNLHQYEGFERVLKFLAMLHELSQSNECSYIASFGYVNTHKVSETERMQKVHEYVMKHFKEEVRLSELASLVSMSESAFCRYFKSRTNKTFFDFIAEIRIGHACKLLHEGSLNITQVAYESGYNTISNFNRQFKDITGKTPFMYQKEYIKGIR